MWTFTNIHLLCCHCYQLWREEGWSEKNNQREVTHKLRTVTNGLSLIHIAIKFHQGIPYGYLVMACIYIVWKKIIKEK